MASLIDRRKIMMPFTYWWLTQSMLEMIYTNFGALTDFILRQTNRYIDELPSLNKGVFVSYLHIDPMIVLSLPYVIENKSLPIRWLCSPGGQDKITTNISPLSNTSVDTTIKQVVSVYNGNYFTSTLRDDRYSLYEQSSVLIYYYYPGSYANLGVRIDTTPWRIVYNRNKLIEAYDMAGVRFVSVAINNQIDCDGTLNIGNGNYGYYSARAGYRNFIIQTGSQYDMYGIPFLNGNSPEMLDLVTMQTVQKTGIWSIDYSFIDGTAWTPIL